MQLLNSSAEKVFLNHEILIVLADSYKILDNIFVRYYEIYYEVFMIAIKPVSDLRNYNEVLQDVADESPVFLTKNGRGCYAVISIKDYEKLTATKTLFAELKKGEDSAKEKGWLSTKDVRAMVGL